MLSDKIPGIYPAIMVLCMFGVGGALAGPAGAQTPLLVQTVQAELEADKQVLSLVGEIVARREVGLSFPMGGGSFRS
jgi:hypothetical protein